jgi:transcriptional regulator with XRE-family HTH domain
VPDGSVALRTDRLKALRETRGWSQRELSRRCGLAENTISKYENGQVDPTASSLKLIADVFEVSIDYLVGITNDPRRNDSTNLNDVEEQQLLEIYRREGWPGVIRLGAERLSK